MERYPFKTFKIQLILALTVSIVPIFVATEGVVAQTESVLYSFAGGSDGATPRGLIAGPNGSLYGTTWGGGGSSACDGGCGTVFQLTPSQNGWVETVLYSFQGVPDGEGPSQLIADGFGNLYGTTAAGGNSGYCFNGSCGTVFELSPTAVGWKETVLYRFGNGADGGGPNSGLAIDSEGNLYGTTLSGGQTACYAGCGVVFELSPTSSGSWNETVLYTFILNRIGVFSNAGVTLDARGNLYGTASGGGVYNYGSVFELSPTSGGWNTSALHEFSDGEDGGAPETAPVLDAAGNLFGTSADGGAHRGGDVYELTPRSGGGWGETTIHSFGAIRDGYAAVGLALAPDGSLYGTTEFGGDLNCDCGAVFQLSPNAGAWKQNILHVFLGSDGGNPMAPIVFDSEGNVYGIANSGGASGYGVIFEITP
jgi:uncharacterized repeat protein (TIGR03803 family)